MAKVILLALDKAIIGQLVSFPLAKKGLYGIVHNYSDFQPKKMRGICGVCHRVVGFF